MIGPVVGLTDLEGLKAGGAHYPKTRHGWAYLYRMRRERGLEHVFRKVGAKVVVDVGGYLAAVGGNSAA